jgi:hypothetical protein
MRMFKRMGLLACVLAAFVPASALGATYNATPTTFSSVLSGASSGDTILLASGSYGTFAGTAKAVTIQAASGATPTMRYAFSTGDANFTLDGISGMGGSITNGANHITVRNSTFTTYATFDGLANSAIVFDHNTHNDIYSPGQYSSPARIHLSYSSSTPSGVTVQNSLMAGGDSDGIQTGVGLNVINNEFRDIIESGSNHTDAIQLLGAPGTVIRGNYIRHASSGIVAYDGVSNATIEDNVVDLTQAGARRPWGIELYSDNGSIVRHNTVVYASGCSWNLTCGMIALDRKSADPAGKGTVVIDNIATEIAINDGSTAARRDHNMVRRNAGAGDFVGVPAYVGPLTTYQGFALASGSPGVGAASDGLNVGIRVGAPPPPPAACGDGVDNDGDGLVDYPADPGCLSATDTDETNVDHAPVARFVASPEPSAPLQQVTFDGTSSTCEDAPCRYHWHDVGFDGTSDYPLGPDGAVSVFTFQHVGTKYVELVLTDADGDVSKVRHNHVVS